ncbi:MAG: DsbA family protein [Thiohalophilus sp.]|uniref:DsbA family protein n=1 Tax=Thiohalophilus sp. TaxID=3028392 RepID=UPI00286FBAF8|nr:DsbA family protein [Thiohalophilus sp.]MDR9437324.1 DsbA family protein [Thiohalophilus sp.]
MSASATLYYIYDPMCSWCWGFRPVWSQVKAALKDKVDVVYVAGGLAPDSDEPMEPEVCDYLQKTWRRISEQCGVEFNFEFWTQNTPVRSTWPSCRATLVAREYGREVALYERIQRFYYQEAGNPSDYASLYDLGEELGIPRETFIERIHSEDIERQLQEEMALAESLGVRGYPSVVLKIGDQIHFIRHSYTDVDANLQQIEALLAA